MKKIKLIAAILILHTFCMGQIIHVPNDQPTIQAAIDASIHSDTILVEDGTYYENINFKGKAIMVASHFIIDGDEDHIDNTIIDGSQFTDPDSASTVMFINGEDTTSIISGFTITGGSGVKVNSPWQAIMGGGIYTNNSGAKITNNHIINNMITHGSYSCGGVGIGSFSTTENYWVVISDNVISGNQSFANAPSSFGGGVYVMNNAIIKNNTIEQNSCYNSGTQADGGGVEVEQGPVPDIMVHIENNLIQNNSVEGASYGLGGGISSLSVSDTYITNNTIMDNVSLGDVAFGGGIYANGSENLIQISNNTIENNSCDATNSYGGGFSLVLCGISIVTDNEINDNTLFAVNYCGGGGGYFEEATDTISILNNNINSNTNGGTSFGGGIGIYNANNVVVSFDGNILSNNYSTQNGGGLWTFNVYRSHISNNVFENNEANDVGGAISFRQYLGKAENNFYSNGLMETDSKNIAQSRDEVFHPVIANNNFINNHANRGGAIDSDHGLETPIIFNSIFLENSAPTGQDIYNYSDSVVLVYNNDIDTVQIFGNWYGVGNIKVDPGFIDEFGHIADTSECIDAGVTSLELNGQIYSCPDHDIDGQFRPLNATADIGVDEVLLTGITPKFDQTKNPVSLNIYPNPFNSAATIEFSTLTDNFISIEVYDITGKEIEVLLSEPLSKGNHKINWNAEGLNEGVYFIRLETNTSSVVQKAIILK